MRKLLIVIGLALFFVIGWLPAVFAAKKNSPHAEKINLYQSPSARAKVLSTVNPSQRLVPIYQKHDWIKVGNPKNGQVGWINRDQYRQAVRKAISTYYQPNIQTLFIRREHSGSGNPAMKIVAYQNGEKLSDKEAKKLYEKIKEQQVQESRYMQQMFWNMDSLMDQELHHMNRMLLPPDNFGFGFAPEIIQPVIVVTPPAAEKKSK